MQYLKPQICGESTIGRIVYSSCGHDKGRYYVIVFQKYDYPYIADGRKRSVRNPKKKNPAHLIFTDYSVGGEHIKDGCVILTNKEIKFLISQFLRVCKNDV